MHSMTVRGKDRYKSVMNTRRWVIGSRLRSKDTDVIALFR
jgi:hypothetical protein